MYLLRGAVGYFALILGLGATVHAGAALTARCLGVAPFRWFDGSLALGSWWRRLAVRVASSLAPLLAIVVLLFVGNLVHDSAFPTTTVEVWPGPAESAGIRTGDRILSVNGKRVEGWESLRSELQRGFGKRQIELERRGQKLVIAVTPRDGRISVGPVFEYRALSAREALLQGLRTPSTVWGLLLKRAFSEHDDKVTLAGPVAIVREVRESRSQENPSFLLFLGLVGCYFWPLAAGVHVFDALTLALFRVTHPWASQGATERVATRLARVQQALLISLMAVALPGLLQVVQETSFGDGALLGIFLLCPAAFAGMLLVGIAAFERWGKGYASLVLAASLVVPCAVVGIAIWLVHWMRSELARRGFRVSWLVTTPEPSGFGNSGQAS